MVCHMVTLRKLWDDHATGRLQTSNLQRTIPQALPLRWQGHPGPAGRDAVAVPHERTLTIGDILLRLD